MEIAQRDAGMDRKYTLSVSLSRPGLTQAANTTVVNRLHP